MPSSSGAEQAADISVVRVLDLVWSGRCYGEMHVSCLCSAFNQWLSAMKDMLGLRALWTVCRYYLIHNTVMKSVSFTL